MDSEKNKSLTAPDEIVQLAGLYDVYGALLKSSHREIFEAYVLDNLSLGEISEQYGITRQGVYDTINRSRKKLRDYDAKLGLMKRFDSIRDELMRLRKSVVVYEKVLSKKNTDDMIDIIDKIDEMV